MAKKNRQKRSAPNAGKASGGASSPLNWPIIGGIVGALAIVGIIIFVISRGNQPASTDVAANPTQGNCTPGNGQTVTTATGLKYEDLEICTGTPAKVGDTVAVHYLGTLENGTKFDSSFDRNQPYPVTLGQGSVIKGWEEGLLGMTVGSKRKLIIPPDLAYGPTGQGSIPANATLLFTVQVMSLNQP